MINTNCFIRIFLLFTGFFSAAQPIFSQAELAPWGNLTGIRTEGQLMEFETSLCVVKKDWSATKSTGKERQRPRYTRNGRQQVVTTNIDSIYFIEKVQDISKGQASLSVEYTAKQDEPLEGIFLCISLPASYNSKATLQPDKSKPIPLTTGIETANEFLQSPVQSIRFFSPSRQLQVSFPKAMAITVKKASDKNGSHLLVMIPIHQGDVQNGNTGQSMFTISASGQIDKKPVSIVLHTDHPGKIFDGFGGNFRLQNPATDPQVIDYCLANMRVAWSRVEMPWRFWQPQKANDSAAQNGKLHPNVQKAMEMAQRLGKMGIPVILSAWSAPAWAIVGAPKFQPGPDGVWGNPLDKNSMNEIYKSITGYIVYLKEHYGVEAAMFSFNESDLGINIRQTGGEHAELIKGLGAYFVSRGLKTKLLLGDNSDATTYEFIYPALNDPATHPYIGAVSFHSWRGWEKDLLQKWSDAADKINRPLIVGEGSIDAQAWGYPAIFEEPTYALQEINLYIRLLAICQPLSILQWQLTADYSPLSGGGIFGDKGPLRPTQRFWNLKQLASTPEGLHALPVSSGAADVSVAALGDTKTGKYVLHIVNNGPARRVNLSGLPAGIKTFQMIVTNQQKTMTAGANIPVTNGSASFKLDAVTYTTLQNQ
ncbi:MAG: hypothetical protein JWP81_3679 [Ferruginibacter sp.]|nr:hypothetical protein [Ferruginibacter sp.]